MNTGATSATQRCSTRSRIMRWMPSENDDRPDQLGDVHAGLVEAEEASGAEVPEEDAGLLVVPDVDVEPITVTHPVRRVREQRLVAPERERHVNQRRERDHRDDRDAENGRALGSGPRARRAPASDGHRDARRRSVAATVSADACPSPYGLGSAQPLVHGGDVVEPLGRGVGDAGPGCDEAGEGAEHLGAFGRAAHDDHRALDDARLLLHATGVRHDERGRAHETEELAVADRAARRAACRAAARARRRRRARRCADAAGGRRGSGSAASSPRIVASTSGSSTFSGRWNVASTNRSRSTPRAARMVSVAAASGRRSSTASTTVLPVTATRVSPVMPSFARFAALVVGRRAAQIGEMVDDGAVVLLGHRPVVRAQPGLDVHERQPRHVRRERAGERRVRVALHDHGRERPFDSASRRATRGRRSRRRSGGPGCPRRSRAGGRAAGSRSRSRRPRPSRGRSAGPCG